MVSTQQGMQHEEVDEKLQIQQLLIKLKRVMSFLLGILFQELRDYAQEFMNLSPDRCSDVSPL